MFWKHNNIQRVAYFSLIILIVILGLLSLFTILIKEKQRKVFLASNKAALSRSINDYVLIKQSQLKQTLQDYTFWDETVDFVKTKDPQWAEDNLAPLLKTYRLQAIWIFDTLGREVYSKTESSCLSLKPPFGQYLFKGLYFKKSVITYCMFNNSLVEIAGTTIHPTGDPDKSTVPRGFMFLAQVWTPAYLDEFTTITKSEIKITTDTVSKYPPSDNKIVITKNFESFDKRFVAQLVASNPSDTLQIFNHFSRILIIVLFVTSVLIIITFFYTSIKYVKRPLLIIEKALLNRNIDQLDKLKGASNEFSDIGNLIKSFMEQREELIIAKEKAEESERLKSAFLANMSHEIRSPLNGIMGFSDLLAEKDVDAEKTHLYASYISGRSKDLLRIINDILDFSKIEAQQLDIISTEFNINKLITELSDLYSLVNIANINSKVVLLFKTGPDINIVADYLRLKQLLINLIDNAIKFTEAGKVEIRYKIYENKVKFTVEDSGIGIPEEKLDFIFDRFTQINDPAITHQKGNGLGLAICKGLIELMHGRIWVESKSGVGSKFHFVIPINPD